jgi:hypothetical protein
MRILMHIQNLNRPPLKTAGCGKQGGFGSDEVLCYTIYNPPAMWETILKTRPRHCNLAVMGLGGEEHSRVQVVGD